jgi:hypothetical protein
VRVAPKRPSAAHPPGFLATLRNDKPAAGVDESKWGFT